jgi:general secretion pathway protein N
MSQTLPRYSPQTFWAWAACGALLGCLVATVAFAPAQWLASVLQQLSHGRVTLTNARGTLWRGSAELTLTGGAGSRDAATLPSRMEWQISPGWGHALASLSSACCTPQPLILQLAPRWGGMALSLSDGQSSWPASMLNGLGTPWNTVQPTGHLTLSSQGLAVTLVEGRLAIAGRAQLEVLDLSSRLSTLRPLGSYRLTLQGGATPGLELGTLEGSLRLTGNGRWVGARLHFEGTASATPDRLEALSNLLNIIGRRNGAQSIISLG